MNQAVLDARESIIREFKGFDNSYKTNKKVCLMSLLKDIEMNPSMSDDDIKRKFNIWYNSACLFARKKSSSMYSHLTSSINLLSELLAMYQCSFGTIYKVDKNFLDWWFEKSKAIENDLKPMEADLCYYTPYNYYMLEYEGRIYCLYRNENGHIIRLLQKFESSKINWEYTADSDSFTCKAHCSNSSCPHYKASNGSVYQDGFKQVFCNLDDMRKCNLANSGVAHPFDIEFVFEGLAWLMSHREYSSSNSEKRDDYEHLPKPERVDDVVVYFGVVKEPKSLPFKVVGNDERSPFPESHASPREHIRRGGERRAYTRKDGVKVRATTVKSTVVNKGHTKTTYRVKEVK